MIVKIKFSALLPILLLVACANMPTGPSMLVLPGTGKNFNQFRNDDYDCRQFAYEQVGGVTPNQASLSSGVASAAIGTAIGAAAGAAIGGGRGAAVGAGTGLLAGGLVGASTAQTSGYEAQQRYDMSYVQCMYANGNKVPVVGQVSSDYTVSSSRSNASIPPPPPGAPPPPPTR